jgi:murein DD-endopeptidase MepM/ murein hydrolase activator NlpD
MPGRQPAHWGPASRPSRPSRRFLLALLVVPLLVGVIGAPAATPVQGDELSNAIARQKELERQIAAQKAQIARLSVIQGDINREIASTRSDLANIASDLGAVRKKIDRLATQIDGVKRDYANLVFELQVLDSNLARLSAEEDQKRDELTARKALLAERIRTAYETDQTSPLELFLTGASFTDVLSEVSYNIDVAEQDQALAKQISQDRETLAELHQTVTDTRGQADELRKATAAQKRTLDAAMAGLKAARAQLAKLQQATQQVLAAQKAAYDRLARNKSALASSMAKANAARKALEARIDKLVREQASRGRIPSVYNGTLRWPMAGTVTQNFGCTGFSWEPPLGSCPHFHRGIDLVAPYGTPVHAAGAGRVTYIGWNYADGADPAWIVIIAHSGTLQTWYAHLQPKRPVSTGQWVSAGQVIGYEGNTGHSTGAHLHWAVRQGGTFVNPRLFL